MKLDKIAVASGNKGKIKEIKQIFTGAETVSMSELGFDGDKRERRLRKTRLSRRSLLPKSSTFPRLRTIRGCASTRSAVRQASTPLGIREGTTPTTEGFCLKSSAVAPTGARASKARSACISPTESTFSARARLTAVSFSKTRAGTGSDTTVCSTPTI